MNLTKLEAELYSAKKQAKSEMLNSIFLNFDYSTHDYLEVTKLESNQMIIQSSMFKLELYVSNPKHYLVTFHGLQQINSCRAYQVYERMDLEGRLNDYHEQLMKAQKMVDKIIDNMEVIQTIHSKLYPKD